MHRVSQQFSVFAKACKHIHNYTENQTQLGPACDLRFNEPSDTVIVAALSLYLSRSSSSSSYMQRHFVQYLII